MATDRPLPMPTKQATERARAHQAMYHALNLLWNNCHNGGDSNAKLAVILEERNRQHRMASRYYATYKDNAERL